MRKNISNLPPNPSAPLFATLDAEHKFYIYEQAIAPLLTANYDDCAKQSHSYNKFIQAVEALIENGDMADFVHHTLVKYLDNTDHQKLHRFLKALSKSVPNYETYINHANPEGKTPLILAVCNGSDRSIDAIKLLVHFGAKLEIFDTQFNTALHYACMRRDLETVQNLTESGFIYSTATLFLKENKCGLRPIQMLGHALADLIRAGFYTLDNMDMRTFIEKQDAIIAYLDRRFTENNIVLDELLTDVAYFKNKINARAEYNIQKAFTELSAFCKQKAHALITKEDVNFVLNPHGFTTNNAFDEVITAINQANSTSKFFGYPNKYWDSFVQFFKRMVGKDRKSVLDKILQPYKSSPRSIFYAVRIGDTTQAPEQVQSTPAALTHIFSNSRGNSLPAPGPVAAYSTFRTFAAEQESHATKRNCCLQ